MKKSIFKKLGGLFLGLAMGLGVAAGVTAGNKASEVKAEDKTLTFNLSKNPGSWPTANSTTLTNYNYTLEGTAYSFALKNVKCNSGYLMLTSTAVLGLPKIEDFKLTKVVAKNTSGCSTAVVVGISSSATSASYIAGGATQTWSKQGSSYTYELTSTSKNTQYYLYVTNKNAQITELALTYEKVVTNYTVSFAVNTTGYGTVSSSSLSVPSGSSITTNGNKVTINGTDVTATPAANTAQYSYAFSSWSNATGTVTSDKTITANFTRTLNSCTVSGTIGNGQLSSTASVQYGNSLNINIKPNENYKYPETLTSVTMGGSTLTAGSGYTYDSSTGAFSIASVTGNVSITATCPPNAQGYNVTWGGSSNVTIDGDSKLYVGQTNTYTITADTGYKLPEDASVVVEGATKVYEKTSYNEATLTLSAVSGNVTISLAGIALANYGVTFTNEDNFIYDGPENIQEFGEATFELLADDHYDLPESVSVVGATTKSYSKTDGILVIYEPMGAVTITVNPVARERYGITVTGAGDSAEFFTYGGDTEIYQTETATVTIAPDAKGTDDIYVINASNIAVIGVSDWSYSNGVVSLSNPTGNVTITVTPVKKVLESIEITTEPTKKTGYNNGDTLETAGMVVTAHYTTGDSPIALTDPDLKFSQTKLAVTGTAGTAKSETIYVYYHGKSASFDVSVAPVATGASSYNKITSTSDLTDGKYLIVYETGNVALDGTLTSDVASNTVAVTISNNSIPSSTTVDAAAVTIDATNKTIKGTYYIGFSGTSNGIKFNQSTAFKHDSITFSNGNVEFKIDNYTMKYNKNSGQERFRYYKSGQEAIQLYKFKEGATKAGVAINAAYTAGSYTAGEEIDLSNLSTTLVYNDGTSSSVSGATISPSTYVEGTAEYTVTYSTYSTVIQIADVAPAKTMTGIRVDDTNVTKAFVVGGTFNSDGLVVYKVFDNGTEEVLESGYDVSTPDLSTAGTKTVTVTYPGFAAQTYNIEVSASPIMNIVEGAAISGFEGESYDLEIELLNYTGGTTSWSFDPASSEYYEIDVTSEDDSGLVAFVTLKKATTEPLTVEISEENSGADPVEITIDVDADYLTGIEVTSSKTTYTDGEYFDYDSVTVTASYASSTHEDEEIDIADCEVTAVNSRSQAFDLDNPLLIETYTITVEYEGKTDSFNISVSMPDGLKVVVGTEHFGSNTYTLVTSTDSLKAGNKYIIVGIKDSAYYAMEAYVSGNNCRSKAINDSPEDGVIDNAATGLCEFTLGGSTGNWTLKGGSYYLYAAGGTSSNHLKGVDSADKLNAQWSISIADDGKATVVTADSAVTKNTMRFNANGGNDPLFSCYSSGQSDIYFYEVTPGESSFTYDYVDVSSTLYAFIRDTYTCEGGGLSSLSGWDDAFNTELNPSYALLTDDDKTILQKGVVSGEVEGVTRESWSAFAGFITSYDRAVASGCTNYLERAKTNPSRINPLLALSNVDNSVWVISAVALVGLTAIGGYFFYRKRKEI